MRLGLLGPAARDENLERAVRLLYKEVRVHRAVYLGLDQALERVVRAIAARLVDDDPGDNALWQRAADRCGTADPAAIDQFLSHERERLALAVFGSLPGPDTRLVELLSGKVAVMIHDKGLLDEDDIASATYLVYGKGPEPMVKPIGSRWFLSPGPLDECGVMTLEDGGGGVMLAQYDLDGRELQRVRLTAGSSAKMRMSPS